MSFPLTIMSPVASPALATYIGGTNIETNLSVYTYTSLPLGSNTLGNNIILGVQGADDNVGADISSVTVDGNAATLLVKQVTQNDQNSIGLYLYNAGTAATGNVVVTYSATRGNAGVVVYRAANLQSITPVDTDSAAPSGAQTVTTATIDKPSNGFVIAMSQHYTTGPATCTWSGLTEDFDGSPIDGANGHTSGASQNVTTGSSAQVITGTWSTSATNTNGIVAVAMR